MQKYEIMPKYTSRWYCKRCNSEIFTWRKYFTRCPVCGRRHIITRKERTR